MNSPEWIAFGGLGLGLFSGICAGVIHAVKTAYRFGQHAQRMDQAEHDIGKLQTAQTEHSSTVGTLQVFAAALDGLKEQVSEVRRDLHSLLTGKIQPARRARADND